MLYPYLDFGNTDTDTWILDYTEVEILYLYRCQKILIPEVFWYWTNTKLGHLGSDMVMLGK